MLLASNGSLDGVVQLITVLVIFVLVLFITLYVTRWIAGFQKKQMNGSNMQVIETMRLTPNQFVQIIKVGNQYLAIAVSKEQVTLLTKLEEDEIDLEQTNTQSADFATVLKQFKKSLPVKGDEENTSSKDDE